MRVHVLHREGHGPRSDYVETFWLPRLGPTALLLWQRLACCDGAVDLDALGEAIGVTRVPVLQRTLERLERYRLVSLLGDDVWVLSAATDVPDAVARTLPVWLRAQLDRASS